MSFQIVLALFRLQNWLNLFVVQSVTGAEAFRLDC